MPAGSEWPVYVFTRCHSGIDSLNTWDHLHKTFQTESYMLHYTSTEMLTSCTPKQCKFYLQYTKHQNYLIP